MFETNFWNITVAHIVNFTPRLAILDPYHTQYSLLMMYALCKYSLEGRKNMLE